MDYPKSVPNIGLVNGRFVDEDPIAGTPGSLVPSAWGNGVTQEILSVISSVGLAPSEADNTQLLKAIKLMMTKASPMLSLVKNFTASKALTSEDLGLILVSGASETITLTLPAVDATLGIRDVIIRRVDNSGNRLLVQCSGTDTIKFHTHLRATGYPFLVLMGAGDWWHLRSDASGSWWPVGRFDNTSLGRPVFETTTLFSPGGYGALNGTVLYRNEWPWLWDHAQQSGMLRTEAARVGYEGGWTSGDGVSTFRGPEGRGEFLRVLDESRGVNPGRVAGSRETDTLQEHGHALLNQAKGTTSTTLNSGNQMNANIAEIGVNAGASTNRWVVVEGMIGGRSSNETRPVNIAYPGRIKVI
jgi:hypothetical protein